VNVRGIEHVGVTVPDIEEATQFLVDAFGAEVLYDLRPSKPPDAASSARDEALLGVRPGTLWLWSRVLRLGGGPAVELFEYADEGQRPPATASDLGIQHLCLLVDDIELARTRVIEAGGTALDGPTLLPGLESGEANKWLYTLTPWGSIVELICLPSPQRYEEVTPLRRWRPSAQ
jgi:catechol 2,3-dioxygenase-like lactoylglutathione lyase family enzyme